MSVIKVSQVKPQPNSSYLISRLVHGHITVDSIGVNLQPSPLISIYEVLCQAMLYEHCNGRIRSYGAQLPPYVIWPSILLESLFAPLTGIVFNHVRCLPPSSREKFGSHHCRNNAADSTGLNAASSTRRMARDKQTKCVPDMNKQI